MQKKVIRALRANAKRGAVEVEVDPAVLRWRKEMREKKKAIGRHMKAQEKKREAQNIERSLNTDEKLLKKKWF